MFQFRRIVIEQSQNTLQVINFVLYYLQPSGFRRKSLKSLICCGTSVLCLHAGKHTVSFPFSGKCPLWGPTTSQESAFEMDLNQAELPGQMRSRTRLTMGSDSVLGMKRQKVPFMARTTKNPIIRPHFCHFTQRLEIQTSGCLKEKPLKSNGSREYPSPRAEGNFPPSLPEPCSRWEMFSSLVPHLAWPLCFLFVVAFVFVLF